MSELPGGWMELKLGDVVHYADNTTVQPDAMQEDAWLLELEDIERDSSRILAYETVGKRKPQSAKNSFHAGDVLYGKLRPYLNKVVRADRNGYSSSEIIAIKPNQLDGGYLFHYLKSPRFRDYVQAVTHGVRMPRLGTEQAKAAPFPLPPLAEQKRIAQKLDALLAQVDTLKARIDAIPALLKRFRESVLTAATNGNLTEDWRTQMGSCENWTKVELADVAREFSYGSAAKSTKQGLVPVLRMGNIQNRLLDWKDLVFTSDLDEIKKYSLKDGDVLFNRTNSPELVGKTAVFKGNRDAIYAGYLIKVKCSARLLPDYLNYCLGSPLGRAYCWKVKSDGVSQSNINAKKLAAFTFDLPSVEEQTEIVRRVEQLFAYADQLEAKVAAAQKRINALTQSLLAKAFRGELVPQDPGDEPASVLLDRIRAQRAAAPKPKRGRKAATS
ncbi:restriction endonuclease subunit S [Xanthomonas oryzae]|uniref:restriction endonuclease subunit S n=1 Tax=Xanthomonas oryzae TaxID=347 RepID=UPI003D184442